jgi:hypothetical protein
VSLARRLAGRYLAALAERAFTRIDLMLAGALVLIGLAMVLRALIPRGTCHARSRFGRGPRGVITQR